MSNLSNCVSLFYVRGFSGSSAVKESTGNAGYPDSIPGSGRYPGEGIAYPLQYSWASLVAQLVKNPPAMQLTWAWSLGWEDSLEEGMATSSGIFAWRIPWTEEPGRLQSMGSQRVGHDWATKHSTAQHSIVCYVIECSVITQLQSDILECKVKLTLGNITMNKASGGDGILAELFQILKDDAVKVLLNMPGNLENSAVATGLEKVSFHSNPKEGQCQRMFKVPHNCTYFTC